jgi:hypothetical protein
MGDMEEQRSHESEKNERKERGFLIFFASLQSFAGKDKIASFRFVPFRNFSNTDRPFLRCHYSKSEFVKLSRRRRSVTGLKGS